MEASENTPVTEIGTNEQTPRQIVEELDKYEDSTVLNDGSFELSVDELPDDALRGILREYARLNTAYENSHKVVTVRREEEIDDKTGRIMEALNKRGLLR